MRARIPRALLMERVRQERSSQFQIEGEIDMPTTVIANAKIVSPEEWLEARNQLLIEEKRVMREREYKREDNTSAGEIAAVKERIE